MKEAVNSKTGKLRLSNLRNEGKGMKKNDREDERNVQQRPRRIKE